MIIFSKPFGGEHAVDGYFRGCIKTTLGKTSQGNLEKEKKNGSRANSISKGKSTPHISTGSPKGGTGYRIRILTI